MTARARSGGRVAPLRLRRLKRAPRDLSRRAVRVAKFRAGHLGRQTRRRLVPIAAAAGPLAGVADVIGAARLSGRKADDAGRAAAHPPDLAGGREAAARRRPRAQFVEAAESRLEGDALDRPVAAGHPSPAGDGRPPGARRSNGHSSFASSCSGSSAACMSTRTSYVSRRSSRSWRGGRSPARRSPTAVPTTL